MTGIPFLKLVTISPVYLILGVLAHMAEVLPPLELLPLLPEEGSTALYLPYIERSHEKQRSQKLKTIIIERAKEFELRPS